MLTGALANIPGRSEIASDHRSGEGLIAGVLPIHYPRALLRAFNILPIEIWGPPRVNPTYGAAHLQPYVCSVVRNALSFLKQGGLNMVDLIVVPHSCDSLQGLGSIFLDFVQPGPPVIPLYLPRDGGNDGIEFLAAELRSLYGQLEEVTKTSPSNTELIESIHREEAADDVLVQLHQHRGNLQLTDYEFYRLIRTREFLPAEHFSDLAKTALNFRSKEAEDRVPIMLSGILPEPMEMLCAISDFGGMIVADDLACCGRRLYPRGKSEYPFLRMAERILSAPPDSTRGSPIGDRLQYLLGKIEETGARGVVFYLIKFCEPELFDLPLVRKGLQDAGIPSVTVEVDLNDPLSNQTLTRIEALLEMIS